MQPPCSAVFCGWFYTPIARGFFWVRENHFFENERKVARVSCWCFYFVCAVTLTTLTTPATLTAATAA